jgi:DNA polymerase
VVSDAPKVDLEQHAQAFSSNSLPLFQQFFKALDSCGPEPSDWSQRVYLTTALKCVPLQHEDALSPQSAVCLTFLREQIRRLKPKVIVVMGRVAAQLLLAGAPEQQLPLGRLRGKVLSFEDTPMLVTFSPEFLLHAQADKALCWEDLCLAQSIEAQTA